MKKITRIIAFSLPILIAMQGCKKDTGPDPSSHEYYQPVKVGEWYRYAVDSSYWEIDTSGNTVVNTVAYTIIESFDTDVPDNSGKLVTRIKLERIDAQPRRVIGFSSIQRFYNASKQEYSVERVDNDVRYVIFKAPVNVPDTFNRNSKNLLPEDIWTNNNVGASGGGPGGNYDHTLRLVKNEYADSVTLITDYELYGFNVGLFYKERTYIDGYDTTAWKTVPIMNRIRSGFSYKKVLIEQGQIK